MSVYVDDIAVCVKNEKWRWPKACHLMADSVGELHIFAAKLGLKRGWCQNHSLPHYDLTENKRKEAIALGAIEIEREQMAQLIRKHRITER